MNRKKVWILGIAIVGMLLCTNLVSASVFDSQNQPTYTLEEILSASFGRLYSPLQRSLTGILHSLFPLLVLNKGMNTYKLNTFLSYDEFVDFLKNNNDGHANQGSWRYSDGISPAINFAKSGVAEAADSSSYGGGSVDFSQTNIQVEGVDEPDTVKTDGTYLYILANSNVYIVKAYPPEDAAVLSKISVDTDDYSSNIFINDDRLIVLGNSYRSPVDYEEYGSYWGGSVSTTIIKIYDVTDREDPKLIKDVEIDGSYFDSRMIGDYLYVIATEYSSNILRAYGDEDEIINIPQMTINDVTKEIPCDQIYYVDIPDRIDTMTHVISIDITGDDVSQKSFLLGSSQSMYVSEDNVFLACTKYEYIAPLVDGDYGHNEQKTILHRISINNGGISYAAQGEVPGSILNQFSMDEHNGFFRIATTISGYQNSRDTSTNNMYVLDGDLNVVGTLEGVAPGESIYSVRFMGERVYMVTFRHIDPLFVIDLKDPTDPQILGKLKIPGYSDYLHPYDETHLIGIGKEVDASIDADKIHTDNAVYYTAIQGVKIAIFDVSDVKNPVELHKEVIGDRGTESLATSDHKAFLFDRERGLLVVPMTVAELKDGQPKSMQGEYVFQGAYVYDISLDDGFGLKGKITHMDEDDELLKSGYYWYGSSSSVTRSLYIGDVLYTFSNSMVKMNDLQTLSEINSVSLN